MPIFQYSFRRITAQTEEAAPEMAPRDHNLQKEKSQNRVASLPAPYIEQLAHHLQSTHKPNSNPKIENQQFTIFLVVVLSEPAFLVRKKNKTTNSCAISTSNQKNRRNG